MIVPLRNAHFHGLNPRMCWALCQALSRYRLFYPPPTLCAAWSPLFLAMWGGLYWGSAAGLPLSPLLLVVTMESKAGRTRLCLGLWEPVSHGTHVLFSASPCRAIWATHRRTSRLVFIFNRFNLWPPISAFPEIKATFCPRCPCSFVLLLNWFRTR